MISVSFSICCSLFMITISIIYLLKKRIKNFDNKLYSGILLLNLIGIFIDVAGYFSFRNFGTDFIINILISKVYLIYYISYIFCLMLYVYNISFKNLNKYLIKVVYGFIALCFFIFCLPIEIHFESNAAYTYGLSVNFAYTLAFICIGIMLFCLFKNIKNIRNKGYIPLIVFVILTVICMAIQKIYPEVTLLLTCNSIVTLLMYFTIENPDVKMMNEMRKNNALVEQTYEDKSNFLFELTQEVRDPLHNITNICEKLKNTDDIDEIKSDIKIIDNSIRQLDFIVNDVLNVSTLDVQKVKFVNSRYNLRSLFDDVVARIKVNIADNIEFRTNIPNKVPYLYGDSIKLKQILFSLIMNSVKKTNSGFIEFNIQILEKYDVCRVIFSIIDSGSGMSLDKINEVLSATGEFDANDIENLEKTELNIKLCQKIIKVLGGNLLIKSEDGKGTEVMLTIDQKIYKKETEDDVLKTYESYVDNSKNVLVVCQDKDISSLLKKKFNDNDISYSFILYGMDAVDRIKSGKKYDYIIVQDDMKEMSGYTTLNEMKKINKFNIPVIVMLDGIKDNIKEHYIKDGFKDYIMLEHFSDEVDRIINKY